MLGKSLKVREEAGLSIKEIAEKYFTARKKNTTHSTTDRNKTNKLQVSTETSEVYGNIHNKLQHNKGQ